MKRKGSFLRRHYANLRGPLKDKNGQPTRLALAAQAWGEKIPTTLAAAKRLAEKGARLLERYKKMMAKDKVKPTKRRATQTRKSRPAHA